LLDLVGDEMSPAVLGQLEIHCEKLIAEFANG
jgi:hypothetical protein